MLRPGGLLACNVKRRMPGMFDGPDGRGRHFTYFDDRELDGLLADAGLRVALASTDADASRPDTCWLARVAERC